MPGLHPWHGTSLGHAGESRTEPPLTLQCIPATESVTSSEEPPKVQIQGLLLIRAPHFLPPYVLLSAEAPPSHHHTACPRAPVPTTRLSRPSLVDRKSPSSPPTARSTTPSIPPFLPLLDFPQKHVLPSTTLYIWFSSLLISVTNCKLYKGRDFCPLFLLLVP